MEGSARRSLVTPRRPRTRAGNATSSLLSSNTPSRTPSLVPTFIALLGLVPIITSPFLSIGSVIGHRLGRFSCSFRERQTGSLFLLPNIRREKANPTTRHSGSRQDPIFFRRSAARQESTDRRRLGKELELRPRRRSLEATWSTSG